MYRNIAVAILAIVLSSLTSPLFAQGEPQAGGTEAMVKRLAEISRTADLRRYAFLNSRRVDMISSVPEPSAPNDQAMYLFMLGQEQLLAGQSTEAARAFEKILKLIAAHPSLPFAEAAVPKVRASLALAYLRFGEQQNRTRQHHTERNLLPIRGIGAHSLEQGSRAAIAAYTELLAANPDDLGFRWLLNLAYMTLGEYPDKVPEKWRIPAQAFASDHDIGRFHDAAPHLGLDVFGLAGGSIMDDFNGDGYLDIVASGSGLAEQLRFFVNNRDGTFTDRTAEARLTDLVGGVNIVQADYNNDGRLDILVLRGAWLSDDGHPNSLLRNDGPGAGGHVTFSDVTEEAGLLSFHPTSVAAWADYDNDGWLDLFVGNESTGTSKHPTELFHNNGRGSAATGGRVTFTEVARESGVVLTTFVKGATWGDIDNDGLPDLYVSNLLAAPNFLFHNRGPRPEGGWRFVEIASAAGLDKPRRGFPAWFFDVDNDGWLDILAFGYIGSIESVAAEYLGRPFDAEYPRLFRNDGTGKDGSVTFSDITRAAGLETVMLAMGANFGDLDNDGWLDIYAGTGDAEYRTLTPNRMFRNDGGKRFQDVTTSGGFGHLQKGHGISFGDLDNDGDQDIYAVMGGVHDGDGFYNSLFANPGHGNSWVTLELEGVTANRAAIGARIKVVVASGNGKDRAIYVTVGSGGSYGASSLRQEIGLGDAKAIIAVEITWPGSLDTQRIEGIEPRRFYKIRQGAAPKLLDLKSFELMPNTATKPTPG